jgi:DNA replication protein DnaC
MALTMSAAVSLPEGRQMCPNCFGTGWRKVSASDARVTRCECKLAARSQRLLESASIPLHYRSCTLESFLENSDQKLVYAKNKARMFVEQYPIDKTGLIFEGTSGSGKTHLAIGMVKALMVEKGTPCFFLRLPRAPREDQKFL